MPIHFGIREAPHSRPCVNHVRRHAPLPDGVALLDDGVLVETDGIGNLYLENLLAGRSVTHVGRLAGKKDPRNPNPVEP